MPRCHISLGGNSGPVAQAFEQALRRLLNTGACCVVAVSSSHATTPVGDQAGAVFLNAAAELETALSPLELLDRLQSVERDLGRTRATHWGPRTLDLDLLFWGSRIIDSPRLVVPHPAAWYRRFVLDPLVEIASRFVHPVKEVEICALRDRLLARPLRVSLAGGTSDDKTELIGLLSASFAAIEFSDWDSLKNGDWLRTARPNSEESGCREVPVPLFQQPDRPDSAGEPALIFWLGPRSGLSDPERPAPATSDFEHLPPEKLADDILQKELRIAQIMQEIKELLGRKP